MSSGGGGNAWRSVPSRSPSWPTWRPNAERLVPRAELVRAVWPDTHVGEGSLRGYVRDLRGLLGDDAEAPRFIETVARLGYRFVATVWVAERRTLDGGGSDAPAPDTVVGRE